MAALHCVRMLDGALLWPEGANPYRSDYNRIHIAKAAEWMQRCMHSEFSGQKPLSLHSTGTRA